jgi:twitching motility protein PilU
MWRLQNDFSLASNAAKAQKEARDAPDDAPSFTEIVLDVKPAA